MSSGSHHGDPAREDAQLRAQQRAALDRLGSRLKKYRAGETASQQSAQQWQWFLGTRGLNLIDAMTKLGLRSVAEHMLSGDATGSIQTDMKTQFATLYFKLPPAGQKDLIQLMKNNQLTQTDSRGHTLLYNLAMAIDKKPAPGVHDTAASLISQTLQILTHPHLYQGKGTDYCAPTSILAALAKSEPGEFTRLAMNLAFDGRTTLQSSRDVVRLSGTHPRDDRNGMETILEDSLFAYASKLPKGLDGAQAGGRGGSVGAQGGGRLGLFGTQGSGYVGILFGGARGGSAGAEGGGPGGLTPDQIDQTYQKLFGISSVSINSPVEMGLTAISQQSGKPQVTEQQWRETVNTKSKAQDKAAREALAAIEKANSYGLSVPVGLVAEQGKDSAGHELLGGHCVSVTSVGKDGTIHYVDPEDPGKTSTMSFKQFADQFLSITIPQPIKDAMGWSNLETVAGSSANIGGNFAFGGGRGGALGSAG